MVAFSPLSQPAFAEHTLPKLREASNKCKRGSVHHRSYVPAHYRTTASSANRRGSCEAGQKDADRPSARQGQRDKGGDGALASGPSRFKAKRTQQYQKFKVFDQACLKKARVFQDCSAAFVETLTDHVSNKVILKDAIIFNQGESGDAMYILNRGEVHVIVDTVPEPVATLTDGAVFGEMAAISRVAAASKRTATIRAATLCDCRVISRDVLMRTMSCYPADAKIIETEAQKRLQELREQGLVGGATAKRWYNMPTVRSSSSCKPADRPAARSLLGEMTTRRATSAVRDGPSAQSSRDNSLQARALRCESVMAPAPRRMSCMDGTSLPRRCHSALDDSPKSPEKLRDTSFSFDARSPNGRFPERELLLENEDTSCSDSQEPRPDEKVQAQEVPASPARSAGGPRLQVLHEEPGEVCSSGRTASIRHVCEALAFAEESDTEDGAFSPTHNALLDAVLQWSGGDREAAPASHECKFTVSDLLQWVPERVQSFIDESGLQSPSDVLAAYVEDADGMRRSVPTTEPPWAIDVSDLSFPLVLTIVIRREAKSVRHRRPHWTKLRLWRGSSASPASCTEIRPPYRGPRKAWRSTVTPQSCRSARSRGAQNISPRALFATI